MRLNRVEFDEQVLVDIISCDNQPELADTHLSCRTVDISTKGMQVVTDMELPVATRLGLFIDLSNSLFRLEGSVRWSRKNGRHFAGLELSPASPDLDDWSKMIQLAA